MLKQTTFGKLPIGTKFRLLVLKPGETKPSFAGLPETRHSTLSGVYTYTKIEPCIGREYYLCNATHNYGRGYLPDHAPVQVFDSVELVEPELSQYPVSPSESFIIY